MAQGDKKNMSVAGDISGTIYHMIVIYGALMQNDDVSSVFFFFSFFQNITIHGMIAICGTQM